MVRPGRFYACPVEFPERSAQAEVVDWGARVGVAGGSVERGGEGGAGGVDAVAVVGGGEVRVWFAVFFWVEF